MVSPSCAVRSPRRVAMSVEPPEMFRSPSERTDRGDQIPFLAARINLLEKEKITLKDELTTTKHAAHQREEQLVGELSLMRTALLELEHHVAVTQGRFSGLLEAARQDWQAEAALGGRAEAARLTTTLHEVEASKELLHTRDMEIAKLNALIETHDSGMLKMEASYKQKLSTMEIKAATSEAQASQLASALESLQTVVREQGDYKAEMQEKLDTACKEVNERDTLINGVQKQLETSKLREEERAAERERERTELEAELQAIGARSIDQVKESYEMEKTRHEAMLNQAAQKEEDLRMKMATLTNSKETEYQELLNIKNRLADTEVTLERERETFKREMSAMQESLEMQKLEVQRYWQTYGKGPVGTAATPKASASATPRPAAMPSPSAQLEKSPKMRKGSRLL
eukprot:TRINITY_DN13422_c0_g1_i3.p1 TRINITY_DN13422_c0_g1~~TRINITY_DN13422_c0_g1_i3.p1  ORF type:complete len:402 (+),score=130.04 TRINITY_DN13422_c0_g1_i3:419-1624(+)